MLEKSKNSWIHRHNSMFPYHVGMNIFDITLFWIRIAPTYYGAMYALAFVCAYLYVKKHMQLTEKKLDILFLYLFLWVIVGGRLGYILLYNLGFYLDNPLDILKTWEWGMSFHGWLLGVIVAGYVFSRQHKESFLTLMDHLAVIAPIWLFLGRIGNFINKELLGLPGYNGPFAVTVDSMSYFPVPLLEALFEGIILFLILFFLKNKPFMKHRIGILFLCLYGIFRFLIEFIRLPDAHIGYIYWDWMTLGHVYSGVMILASFTLLIVIRR